MGRPRIFLYGDRPWTTPMSWLGDERIAVGAVPTTVSVQDLPGHGVTHVVNCRARRQTWLSRDLAAERVVLGDDRVAHAPMWDHGGRQHPRLWSTAVHFAVAALAADDEARVLIHCHQGRRRSALVAYAVLRLRGHDPERAAALILTHRVEAKIVPSYQDSVEEWIAAGAAVTPL